jgi:CheY-like chemotaxis protein
MKNIPILLIEDNCDDEWLAVRALKKNGFENIYVARNGLDALSMMYVNGENLDNQTCEPGLILLDLRLPKIDGLDVLRRIRSEDKTKSVKVVVLTSSEDPHDKAVCNELGVSAFITKPVDEKMIQELVLFE